MPNTFSFRSIGLYLNYFNIERDSSNICLTYDRIMMGSIGKVVLNAGISNLLYTVHMEMLILGTL